MGQQQRPGHPLHQPGRVELVVGIQRAVAEEPDGARDEVRALVQVVGERQPPADAPQPQHQREQRDARHREPEVREPPRSAPLGHSLRRPLEHTVDHALAGYCAPNPDRPARVSPAGTEPTSSCRRCARGTRCTTSSRTRRPATPTARASTASAPSGTCSRRPARRSRTTTEGV